VRALPWRQSKGRAGFHRHCLIAAAGEILFFVMLAMSLTLVGFPPCASAQSRETVNRSIFARSLLSNHLVDSASKIVETGLAADSLDANLWVVKARIHAARRDRPAELVALRRALAIQPNFLEVHQMLTEVYCDSGLTDSASRYMELPLRIDSLNPRVAYFRGRICQQRGQLDSAAAMYLRAYELLSASELLRLPVCPGYRIRNVRLRTTGPDVIQIISGRPTLLLFWATWSPESMKALKAIMHQVPKAGITWSLLPVNVDEWRWRRSTRQRVEARVRELGYKDPVPVDSGLSLFDRFGLVRVPTLIATNIAGEVDVVESGWSQNVADQVVKGLLGAGDSASRLPQQTRADCRRALRLLGTAWQYWEDANPVGALRQVSRVIRECSTSAYPHALSAAWRWQWSDTLRAGRDASDAMRADSTDPWGWLAVAEVERRRSHLDLAGQAIQRALQLDSSLAPAWAIVGRLAAAVGDTAKVRQAISVLEHLNRIDPGLYVLRALLLRSSGSLGEAVAVWRELLDPRM